MLEKSWQTEIGEYRPIESLYDDGKDVAILILENPITNINGAAFPTVFKHHKGLADIEVYGYPECNFKPCFMATGRARINQPIDKQWGICSHTASTIKGKNKKTKNKKKGV